MSKNKVIVHAIALACAILGFYLSYKVTCYLFLPHQPYVTLFSYAPILWATQDWFFRLLVLMNFFVKPLFIYYLVSVLLGIYVERKNRPSAKK